MTTAIYAGSFDPFTNGHLDIIKKASPLFDKVTIVIAINHNKLRKYNAVKMCQAIEQTLHECGINNCVVGIYNGLIAELTRSWKCQYLIRGLRNSMDYNYEENIAKINAQLDPQVETIYFRSSQDIVSSTFVKELYSFNHDISNYVPPAVLKLMEEYK